MLSAFGLLPEWQAGRILSQSLDGKLTARVAPSKLHFKWIFLGLFRLPEFLKPFPLVLRLHFEIQRTSAFGDSSCRGSAGFASLKVAQERVKR